MGRKNRRKQIAKRFLMVMAVLLLAALFFTAFFRVTKVEIVGNTRISDKKIEAMCMNGILQKNSVLASGIVRRLHPDSPYIESVEIEYAGRNALRLVVKEKVPIGYMQVGNILYYFDKDGTVLERAKEKTQELAKIPLVTGLPKKAVEEGKKIPLKNREVFRTLLTLSKLLEKFSLTPEEILLDSDYQMTIRFDTTQIKLGKSDALEEKVSRAAAIYPQIQGQAGILHLEDFTKDTKNIIFDPEETKTQS